MPVEHSRVSHDKRWRLIIVFEAPANQFSGASSHFQSFSSSIVIPGGTTRALRHKVHVTRGRASAASFSALRLRTSSAQSFA